MNLEVVQVHASNPWSSEYGNMIGWEITVRDTDTGEEFFAEINSKEGGKDYNVGDKFEADIQSERNGVPKLKRAQPQQRGGGYGGGGQRGAPPQQRRSGPPQQQSRQSGGQQQRPQKMSFEQALRLHKVLEAKVMAQYKDSSHDDDTLGAWVTSLFIGVIRGDFLPPAPPPPQQQRQAPQEDPRDYPPPDEDGDSVPF